MPIDAINAACVREKSIRHGHPSTLHIYWARRPLAAARAVLFAQLIDDPSSRPDLFPTIEEQDEERKRLHRLIERAVKWEATTDQRLLDELKAELQKQFPEGLPTVLDPFAGGGAIPIESARLGLPTEASDLNPLAVLLNKAMIEIPQQFIDQPSLNNSEEFGTSSGMGHLALANDVRHFSRKLLSRVWDRVGSLYPKAYVAGQERTVIGWYWARTVPNLNPMLPIDVPLVKSWVVSKRSGNEYFVEPSFDGERILYSVREGLPIDPAFQEGTVGKGGGVSVVDGTTLPLSYIRNHGLKNGLGSVQICTVVDGDGKRLYLEPQTEVRPEQLQELGLNLDELPNVTIPGGQNTRSPGYGLDTLHKIMTDRQKLFYQVMLEEMEEMSFLNEEILDLEDSKLRIAAIRTYLSLGLTRTLDYGTTLCTWHSGAEKVRNLFARQVIPMSWDFFETNPFSSSTGNYLGQVEWVARALERAPLASPATVSQQNASQRDYSKYVVSTDPPYYDNIGYADLSDMFYVVLRKALRNLHPSIFSTLATPKAEELVADRIRHGSREAARNFFVEGFNRVFSSMKSLHPDVPLTVYYAYKQTETDPDGVASTGWETLLDGMLNAGFEITGTWPLRTEMQTRTVSVGNNALASSIVLVCRQRSADSEIVSRRSFVAALRDELPVSLRSLIATDIAPVDFAQSAIGPGMAVFSRYKFVQEPDGSQMKVREALLLINEILGELLNDQDIEMDPDSRFAMEWYKGFGWTEASSGLAETLATAKDTSINDLVRSGVFEAKAGKARLLRPSELTQTWDPSTDDRVSIWECVVRLSGILEKDGIDRVASLLPKVERRVGLDKVKSMAYFAFYTAEKLGNSKDAGLFNALVSSWSDIAQSSAESGGQVFASSTLFDETEDLDGVEDVS
jgi:putative DNA methylase